MNKKLGTPQKKGDPSYTQKRAVTKWAIISHGFCMMEKKISGPNIKIYAFF